MGTGPHDLAALQALALRVAAAGAAVHRAGLERVQTVGTKSSPTDMVTEVDRDAERVIVELLATARPRDAILAEEGSSRDGTSGVRWVIDPLDGTTNYLYRYPAFAVSVGVEVDGQGVVGVVHDALHEMVYAGRVGAGATCNGRPITVSDHRELATALVATGFQPRRDVRARQAAVLAAVLPHIRDIRRGGSAALDLCLVASGRVDAFYEVGLAEWDIAAGCVIAAAAGAQVLVVPVADGSGWLTLAGNPVVVAALRARLVAAGMGIAGE